METIKNLRDAFSEQKAVFVKAIKKELTVEAVKDGAFVINQQGVTINLSFKTEAEMLIFRRKIDNLSLDSNVIYMYDGKCDLCFSFERYLVSVMHKGLML